MARPSVPLRSPLVERCAECGFDYDELPRAHIAGAVRGLADQFRSRLLGTGHEALRRRPAPTVWSPLERSAHVRDVLLEQRQRVLRALIHDAPTYEPMRRRAREAEPRDDHVDPVVVASQLVTASDQLAELLEGLSPEEWERIGVDPWPERTVRDITWIGRDTVHEQVHNLFDLARAVQGPAGTPNGMGSG